jgi:hypothetical protein
MSSLTVPTKPRRDGGSLAGRKGLAERPARVPSGRCLPRHGHAQEAMAGASSFGSSQVLAAGNHDPRGARTRMSATQNRGGAPWPRVSWLGRRGATGKHTRGGSPALLGVPPIGAQKFRLDHIEDVSEQGIGR